MENTTREEIQKHWDDPEWLLGKEIVTRRPTSDWKPIEEALPDIGKCWITIELEHGDRYVTKGCFSKEDIDRGIRREHPCIVAWMPYEIAPLPYVGDSITSTIRSEK